MILLHCDLSYTIENWEIKNFETKVKELWNFTEIKIQDHDQDQMDLRNQKLWNQYRRTLKLHRNQDQKFWIYRAISRSAYRTILVSVKFQSSSILVSKVLRSWFPKFLISQFSIVQDKSQWSNIVNAAGAVISHRYPPASILNRQSLNLYPHSKYPQSAKPKFVSSQQVSSVGKA